MVPISKLGQRVVVCFKEAELSAFRFVAAADTNIPLVVVVERTHGVTEARVNARRHGDRRSDQKKKGKSIIKRIKFYIGVKVSLLLDSRCVLVGTPAYMVLGVPTKACLESRCCAILMM